MKKGVRFVIQRHERQGEPAHWDLMLESGDILETYRVGEPPQNWGNGPVEAIKIFDHPLKFLNYEGPVNKGKGNVTIADSGICRVLSQNDNQLTLHFEGKVLKGEFALTRIEGERRRFQRNVE